MTQPLHRAAPRKVRRRLIILSLLAATTLTAVVWRNASAKAREDEARFAPPTLEEWQRRADTAKIPKPDIAKRPLIPAAGNDTPYPGAAELAPYLVSLGYRSSPTDQDAEWLLSIAERHPDYNVRVSSMTWMPFLFSGGGARQGPRSQVSRELRDRATQVLLENLYSNDDTVRQQAVSAVGSGRLWLLYPEFADPFMHLRNDPVKLIRDYVEQALLNRDLRGFEKLE